MNSASQQLIREALARGEKILQIAEGGIVTESNPYRAALIDALKALNAARSYGSQGDTDDGVSVSYLIEEAIKKAEGVLGCAR